MNIEKAAAFTVSYLSKPPVAERDPAGSTVGHALWMLEGIIKGYIQYEKAHRWLGYAQGLLVLHKQLDLKAVKNANKRGTD